ncbi:MAG: hypothetical protein ABIP53_12070 [Candidatus Limnocylindrales bacterium]
MALVAVFLLAAVGPVHAASGPPQQVDLFACSTLANSAWSIDHTKDVYIKFGWATNTWRQLRQFLNVATLVVRVDGVRVRHQAARWGLPFYDDEAEYWAVWWSTRLPRFTDGESRTVTVQLFFAKRHFDGIEYFGPGKFYEPRLTCKVTAE